MAGGGNVWPSITGGGLTRGTASIFEAVLAKKARELQERQLDQADLRIEQDDTRIEQGERQLTLNERASALDQFTAFVGYLEPGTMLGSIGQTGMELFTQATGVPFEGLEELDLKSQTLQDVLDDARAKFYLENPDVLPQALRAEAGLEPNVDVDFFRGMDARTRTEALTLITENPRMKFEYVERFLGREPVNLIIPGIDGADDISVSFDGSTAANIYAQFLLAKRRNSFELEISSGEEESGLVKEIIAGVAGSGHTIVSTVVTGRVLPVYNQAAAAKSIEPIMAYLNNPSTTEGERLAMQLLMGSIKAGEETYMDRLRVDAPLLADFIELSAAVTEAIPTAEQAAELLPGITQYRDGGFTLKDKLFGGLELTFGEAPTRSGVRATQAYGDFGAVPRDQMITAARNVLTAGTMTRAQLLAQGVGEDIINAAMGTAEAVEAGVDPSPPPPAGSAAERAARSLHGAPTAAAPQEAPAFPVGGYDPEDFAPGALRIKATQLNTLLRRAEDAKARGVPMPRGQEAVISRHQRDIRAAIELDQGRARIAQRTAAARAQIDSVTFSQAAGEIPAGGIDPASLAPVVREDVLRLNDLIRQRAITTGPQRRINQLDTSIRTQKNKIVNTLVEEQPRSAAPTPARGTSRSAPAPIPTPARPAPAAPAEPPAELSEYQQQIIGRAPVSISSVESTTTPAGFTDLSARVIAAPAEASSRRILGGGRVYRKNGREVYDSANADPTGGTRPTHIVEQIQERLEQGQTVEALEQEILATEIPRARRQPVDELSSLDTAAAEAIRRLIQAARRAGITLSVAEAARSQDRQDWLFQQGRSRPGNIVTWTLTSDHLSGRSADLLPLGDVEAGLVWIQENAGDYGLSVLGMIDPGHVTFLPTEQ